MRVSTCGRYRKALSLLAVVLAAFSTSPGAAVASREVPGAALRLSLGPDDPFFIDGDVVTVVVQGNVATTISGDLGLGLVVSEEMSAGACPSPGDRLLFFLPVGTGGGTQCLSTWLSTPASRIAQFPGVTLPAGTQFSAELLNLSITSGFPRGVFVFFGYILDSGNRDVIRDVTVTTLDVE